MKRSRRIDRRSTDDRILDATRLLSQYHLTVKQMRFMQRLKYCWFIMRGLTDVEKARLKSAKEKANES